MGCRTQNIGQSQINGPAHHISNDELVLIQFLVLPAAIAFLIRYIVQVILLPASTSTRTSGQLAWFG